MSKYDINEIESTHNVYKTKFWRICEIIQLIIGQLSFPALWLFIMAGMFWYPDSFQKMINDPNDSFMWYFLGMIIWVPFWVMIFFKISIIIYRWNDRYWHSVNDYCKEATDDDLIYSLARATAERVVIESSAPFSKIPYRIQTAIDLFSMEVSDNERYDEIGNIIEAYLKHWGKHELVINDDI